MASPREHLEHVTFVNEFKRKYPKIRIFAIPNGGFRDQSAARKLMAEGVSPGVPDLYIPAWHLWVEMKRQKGGRLSQDQKDWIEYLEGIGDSVIVGKGWQDCMDKIEDFRK